MAFGMQPVCDPPWPDACATVAAPLSINHQPPAGRVLEGVLDLLDELAWSLGVVPLSQFTDHRLIPDEWAHDPALALARLGPRDDWYPMADGLTTCSALLRELQRNPQAELPAEVLPVVQALNEWLALASAHRTRFRLDSPGDAGVR